MNRRLFVQGMALCAGGLGLLKSIAATAMEWPKALFDLESEADVVKNLFGDMPVAESSEVAIKAPLQAENGAVVPIKVTTSVADAESISIVVEKNPSPFVTSVKLQPGSGGLYSARIKMGATSKVTAYVKAGGKVHTAAQEIKVTVGGCGG